jgi:hypothetical protein
MTLFFMAVFKLNSNLNTAGFRFKLIDRDL